MSEGSLRQQTRIDSFIPFDTGPLPRPLHRFGTTFPQALADTYCGAYTPRRGVVLDPFARPGSAADAAEAADRRSVARHVALFGEWARRVLVHAPAEAELVQAFDAVRDHVSGDAPLHALLADLYASVCPTCHAPVVVEAFLWERDAPIPSRKAFRCGVCGRGARALVLESIDDGDIARASRIDVDGELRGSFVARFGAEPAPTRMPASGGPPADPAHVGIRAGALADARGFGESVVALYTPRNVAALELLLRAIDAALPEGRARAFLRLALLEPLVAGSRLNAVTGTGATLRVEKGRARRGAASQHREINLWLEFERSFRELLQHVRPAAGTVTRPALGRATVPLPDLDAVTEPADLVLFEVPTADALGGWHAVAATLLMGAPVDVARVEARANARERVLQQVRSALLEARRATRDGAPAVTFVPHADGGSIAATALAATAAGYRLRRALFQPDALAGGGRGTARAAAAVCELEPVGVPLAVVRRADALRLEEVIRAGVRNAILARGEPVEVDRAVVAALEALAGADLLPALALTRAGGVSELEVFFDRFRSALADGAKGGLRKVTHRGEEAYAVEPWASTQLPLDDRVEWSVYSLLSTMRGAETRGLLRRVFTLFRGIETPDRELVLRCLASYGVQDGDGRWSLRAADQLAARQDEHAALVGDLVHLARRLGFRAWVGPHILRRPAVASLLTEEERRAYLPSIVRGPSDVLVELDCAWYGRGGMAFVWKVDWTARLHHALVTIGEAIPDTERVFRFLVVPEERRELIRYKFQRAPALAGVAQQRGWRLVKYGPLRDFTRQADVDLNGLEPILGLEPAVEQAGHQLVFHW